MKKKKQQNMIIGIGKMVLQDMKDDLLPILKPFIVSIATVGVFYVGSIIVDKIQPYQSLGPMNNFALAILLFVIGLTVNIQLKNREIKKLKEEVKRLEDM